MAGTLTATHRMGAKRRAKVCSLIVAISASARVGCNLSDVCMQTAELREFEVAQNKALYTKQIADAEALGAVNQKRAASRAYKVAIFALRKCYLELEVLDTKGDLESHELRQSAMLEAGEPRAMSVLHKQAAVQVPRYICHTVTSLFSIQSCRDCVCTDI